MRNPCEARPVHAIVEVGNQRIQAKHLSKGYEALLEPNAATDDDDDSGDDDEDYDGEDDV